LEPERSPIFAPAVLKKLGSKIDEKKKDEIETPKEKSNG
jgi:hypothetical protein